MKAARRKLAWVGATLALVLSVIAVRAIVEGGAALEDGDRALAEGRELDALRHWRRAARWQVPMAPHVEGAYERMEDLAQQAKQRGDRQLELQSWRGIRSSVLATRSFYTPHGERLGPANDAIAGLMASLEDPALDPTRDEGERAAWHLELLERNPAPHGGFVALALFGFLVWVAGAFGFAYRGVGADDRLRPRAAAYAGGAVALGLFTWLAGLYAA